MPFFRLFEMGFQEQLNEIIHKLPETRQTLLFSATLPKLLVEFAKAGLHDPTLIRLDVETKISENLKVSLSIYSHYISIDIISAHYQLSIRFHLKSVVCLPLVFDLN